MPEAADPRPGIAFARANSLPCLDQGVDFHRNVYCVLGLPFDAIEIDAAVQQLRHAAAQSIRTFISTPNVHFVVLARRDPAFRTSVLQSHLTLVDGMPLLWIARLHGIPIRQRVSGASLWERMAKHRPPPIKAFLFGGPPGAAAAACASLNSNVGSGITCVGFDDAGFGSLESMSEPDRLEAINSTGAQFVVAALGAHKGQAWLQHNAERLSAPLLCHLGAVINFTAGTVQRAPEWVQGIGLEWLWRIGQEPTLWRRYWHDGLALLGLGIQCVVPSVLAKGWRLIRHHSAEPGTLTERRNEDVLHLSLHGEWTASCLQPLRNSLSQAQCNGWSVRIDLAHVTGIDPAFVGLLLLASATRRPCGAVILPGTGKRVRRSFNRLGAGFLLHQRTPALSTS